MPDLLSGSHVFDMAIKQLSAMQDLETLLFVTLLEGV